MDARQFPALAIEHVEGSSPAAFKLARLEDGKSLAPVAISSPYEFPVEGRPNSPLMRELRWYLEQFLDYPFHPETDHAEHVLDALRAWGTQAFNALFDRRDAGDWLGHSSILQVRADDPHVLSWPWEALYDQQAGAYLAHQRRMERRLNRLPDPHPPADLPNERVNILLVVCRPYERDVRYRSVARPLIELIQTKNLPAHVDILRPPTFDQLRKHLRQHPGYYHMLHFDGHGEYGHVGDHSSGHQFGSSQGYLVFEDKNAGPDPKSAREISALLHEYAVPAVVLNACQSATLDEKAEDAFATVATALLRSGMRSVVAMAYSLYVSGAQVFLPEFYRSLFQSGSVAEGVRAGRQQMLANKKRMSARGPFPLEDWLLPVLYQQAPLDFDFAKQAKLEARESRLPQEVVQQREAYGFIGRDGPILEMERALQRNTPCILVQGLGGVGKTTLARGFLRWLDDTGGLDGALWFDFLRDDIRTAEYVLNRTGEKCYGENFGAQPNKLDLLADALRQRRVLMVWDNFESAAENLIVQDRNELGRFLDAISGTQGKVIMTSRSQEEWLGTTRPIEVRLSGLEGEERWEYCETILRELRLNVDRDDPQLKGLMDQLAGHPLAMRVVLPRLEHMPAAKVGEALRTNIADLGLNEQEEQGRLFATLRFVEQGLPEQLRPMMGLIALHEGYLDADYLEAMAKRVDPEWTRRRIDRLVAALARAGLVRDIGGGDYEIHPLLTSYLRSRSESPEACQSAFVDVMGSIADQLTLRPYHEQRAPFLLHGANFHFALQLSQRQATNWAFAALTQCLAAFAQKSRNLVEASRLFTQLAQHRVARADWEGEASAYHQLGMVAQEQGDFATAREWYLKSLAISEKQGILNGAALTYHNLGAIAEGQRDFATAQGWYLKSLAISEKQGILNFVAGTYHNLGRMAQDQRDLATAREWYLKSLAIKEKQGDLHGAASTYHQLGMIAQEQRDFTTAREWHLKSLAISEKQGILNFVAGTYHQLGMIAEEQGAFATAREWYLKSLAISEKQGILHGASSTYHQLGIIAQEQGDFATAQGWYLKSLAISEKQGILHQAALTYDNLGTIAGGQRDFATAQEWYLKSLAIKEKQGDLHGASHTYHQLGIIAQEQGDFATAREWYLKSLAISESHGNLQVAAGTYHNLGRIAQDQRDLATAREWYLKSLAIKEKQGDLHGAAGTYHQLGGIAQDQRDFATAREWYLKSLAIEEKQGNILAAAISYNQLGRIAQQQQDFATARELHLKSLAILEKQGILDGAASTYHVLGSIALEEQDLATAREWYLKSLATKEKLGDLHGATSTYHQLGMIAQEQRDFTTARELHLKSLAILEKQGILDRAAWTYHQLGVIAQTQLDLEAAREWYLKALAIDEKNGDLRDAPSTYAALGNVAAMQGRLEESGKWTVRAITAFRQTHQEHAQGCVGNFLHLYQHAPPREKEKLKAIWLGAGLGPFPETA